MATSFKSLAVQFLTASVKLETLAADMRDQFEDPTNRAFVRSECLPIVAEFYGIKLVQARAPSGALREGVFTLPDTHKSYKVAANKLSLMVNAIVGHSSKHTPKAEVKVTRAMKAEAATLVELCGSKAAAIAAIKALK